MVTGDPIKTTSLRSGYSGTSEARFCSGPVKTSGIRSQYSSERAASFSVLPAYASAIRSNYSATRGSDIAFISKFAKSCTFVLESVRRIHTKRFPVPFGCLVYRNSRRLVSTGGIAKTSIARTNYSATRSMPVSGGDVIASISREFYAPREVTFGAEQCVTDVRSEHYIDTTVPVDVYFEDVLLKRKEIQFKIGSSLPRHTIVFCRYGNPKIPLSLSNAKVRLVARHHISGDLIINKYLEVLDPALGKCQYVREPDEFSTPASCNAEFVIEYDSGEVMIVPQSGYYRVSIERPLMEPE